MRQSRSNGECRGASSGAWLHWEECHILHPWWPLHVGWLVLLRRGVACVLIYALVGVVELLCLAGKGGEVVGEGVLVPLVAFLLA